MPVTITIELEKHDTLLAALERAGLLRSLNERVIEAAGLPVVGTLPVGVHVPGPPVQTPYDHEMHTHREPPAETVIVDMPPDSPPDSGKRSRGRPKGTTATVMAARKADPEPTMPAPSLDYVVRRYGGETDSEHATAKSAMARLIELVGAAGDLQALDELMDCNGDLVEALRADDAAEVQRVVEETRADLTPPAPPQAEPQPEPEAPAPAAPTAPTWPFNQDNVTLTAITPDQKGGRDVVWAIATGAAPKYGHLVALALLEQHGVQKLSSITDPADPRWAKIAEDGAKILGLPMAAPAGGLM